jgi:DNA-binding transcriptional LysR family regulator
VFEPLARDLAGRAERAGAVMRGLADPTRLRLRLVAPETTVTDVVAPFLAGLAADMPMVDVREALPASIYEQVER